MTLDTHGNPITGSDETVSAYGDAIGHWLRYSPHLVDSVGALTHDPDALPMGQALMAYLCLSSTDAPDVTAARACAATLSSLPLNERERAHCDAVDAWSNGRWQEAARLLDDLLVRWPTDVLALLMGHVLDFFTGDAENLRDRVGRSLPSFDPEHPHFGFLLGMHAFGLEESGRYGRSELAGLEALGRNPDDVWATHAVVHTYEMQGRVDEGIRFLSTTEANWGADNLFTVHNWWHLALYLLEAGRIDDVLAIYDTHVHHAESMPVSLELLDASALLWRLRLDDIDTGTRFAELAGAWSTWLDDDRWYAFNDAHAVVAFAGAGRLDDARELVGRMQEYAAGAVGAEGGSNPAMTAEVGLPVARAMVAHAEDRHDEVVEQLLPVRRISSRFGGSHAQRDLIQRTLTDSAIRSGRLDLARALLDERLSERETSVYGLLQRARVLSMMGKVEDAQAAEELARTSRARFAAAR
jgi:hypothetical protein